MGTAEKENSAISNNSEGAEGALPISRNSSAGNASMSGARKNTSVGGADGEKNPTTGGNVEKDGENGEKNPSTGGKNGANLFTSGEKNPSTGGNVEKDGDKNPMSGEKNPSIGANVDKNPSNGDKNPSVGDKNRRLGRASPVQPGQRIPLAKISEEKRAKRCKFYRNGDRFFGGRILPVGGHRHRNFGALLVDLTRSLDLVSGARAIFRLDGTRVSELSEMSEGEYVVSGNDVFKRLDYTRASLPHWRSNVRRNEAIDAGPFSQNPGGALLNPNIGSNGSLTGSNGASNPIANFQGVASPVSTPGSEFQSPLGLDYNCKDSREYIRPKLVTVIRNGVRPRKAMRILLNKRTARSLEQVLSDITSAIKLDSGAVRKVYTLDGRQVSSLRDFFYDDDIFIAYGQEKLSHDDFDLDSEECKTIQPLVKCPLSPRRPRRMPSPKPRGRAVSPLTVFEGSGSLPRTSRKPRSQSPYKRASQSLSSGSYQYNGHVACAPLESIIFPHCVTSKYSVGRILGDGNFAEVRGCVCRKTKEEFALKIIDKNKCRGKEHMIESEVYILRQVSHSNIVSLIEEFDTTNYLYLVMELVKGGDLFDAIASATRYTEQDASSMIHDLTSALDYLHQRSIVHRDIKPENLLVVERPDDSKSLKLGDFGLAVEVTEPLFTVCGTPTYVAPEILKETGYGLKVDIWATGVITYILLCGFPPFVSPTNNQEELFDQILRGYYEFHSPYWDDIGESARELIVHMLQVDQDKRFTAQQVLHHPWLSDGEALDKHLKVTHKLDIHFNTNGPQHKSAGITLMAVTALDKETNNIWENESYEITPPRSPRLSLFNTKTTNQVF